MTINEIKSVLEKIIRVKVRIITIVDGGKEKGALMIDRSKRWKIARLLVKNMTVETFGDYMLAY